MFVKFLILAGIIFTAGPVHNEGGGDAVQEKGFRPAIKEAIKESETTTLRGNYGNQ
jgi:hypothetical protein